MLHLGADFGLGAVLSFIGPGQRMAAGAFVMGEVLGTGCVLADYFGLPGIGAVTPDPGLFPMQQVRQGLGVMGVGRGGEDGVDQLGFTIHADMGFHAKIPRVAFLGLTHLWITLAFFILG